jgi:hypothetical protein
MILIFNTIVLISKIHFIHLFILILFMFLNFRIYFGIILNFHYQLNYSVQQPIYNFLKFRWVELKINMALLFFYLILMEMIQIIFLKIDLLYLHYF